MPDDVAQAIDTMSNPARTEILRALMHHPPMTRTQIADVVVGTDGVRGNGSMIRNHLLAMEAAGTVTCDLPLDGRHGRSARWTTTADQIQAVADTVLGYLTGRKP